MNLLSIDKYKSNTYRFLNVQLAFRIIYRTRSSVHLDSVNPNDDASTKHPKQNVNGGDSGPKCKCKPHSGGMTMPPLNTRS